MPGELIWSVFENMSQSNSRFNALDKLVIEVHSVKMPVGFGRVAIKSKGRPLSVMVHLKGSIVEVKAEKNCLANALITDIAKLTNDSNYKAYRQERMILPVVQQLLETTGINLDNGAGIPELTRFRKHFNDYRIVVYEGLTCDQIMFDGRTDSPKRIHLHFDELSRHYHVINNLTGAMAKKYVLRLAIRDVSETLHTYVIRHVVIACQVRRVYRQGFESPVRNATDISGARNVTIITRISSREKIKSLFCEIERCCVSCGYLITRKGHECNRPFCQICGKNREIGHFC
jgi:hypothetical protein